MIGRFDDSGIFPALTPEQIEDANEICDEQRIDYMRSMGIELDPDGYDSADAIRAALNKTTRRDFL